MKKILGLLFLIFFVYFPTYLKADIYDDFTNFRVSLYNKESVEEIMKALSEWENNFATKNLSDEEKLTLKNLFVLEKTSEKTGIFFIDSTG